MVKRTVYVVKCAVRYKNKDMVGYKNRHVTWI